MGRYWHRPNHEAVVDLRALASAEGRSMTSLSLNWILHHSPADAIILGASNLEQLTENLNAVREGALAPQIVSACNDVWTALRGVAPQYNR
jgi:aryl-alcohol dehydrogenase-like predicted oxidoreductase